MEAQIFVDGVSIAFAGLEPELLKELKKVAEDPGCSEKRYKLTSVILHTQEIPHEIAEAERQQEDIPQEIAEAEGQQEDTQQEDTQTAGSSGDGASRKRKAADS